MGNSYDNGVPVAVNPKTGGAKNEGEVMKKVDIALGNNGSKVGLLEAAANGQTLKVELGLGTSNEKEFNVHFAVGDKDASPASGYLANGAPHWGDGVMQVNTVYADDIDESGRGVLVINRPQGTTTYSYDNLST